MGKAVKKALDKKYDMPFNLSESTVSMILGAIVVVLVGLIAFNFFKTQREEVAKAPTPQVSITPVQVGEGQVGGATISVALPVQHTVAEGETLWTIAEKYYGSGHNFADIIVTNKIVNPDVIEAGQKITIPKAEVKEKTIISEAPQPTVTESKIQADKYTVIAGDDLWDVAVRAYGDGYKWVEIARANNITNPDVIHVGNVLIIPRK